MYNAYRQHSELKHLKKILGENEIICSVDFANNYENKHRNEIQSAYFGHEAFSIYTAAVYYKSIEQQSIDSEDHLNVWSAAIVCNETKHERNLAYACSMKLIEEVRQKIPDLKRVYFWSDGCGKEFRSHFTFLYLTLYPSDIMLSWDYGGRHTILRDHMRELVDP